MNAGPLQVACPVCFVQPGTACLSDAQFGPLVSDDHVHFDRIETANFDGAAQARLAGKPGFEPSTAQFDSAVLATGDLF